MPRKENFSRLYHNADLQKMIVLYVYFSVYRDFDGSSNYKLCFHCNKLILPQIDVYILYLQRVGSELTRNKVDFNKN